LAVKVDVQCCLISVFNIFFCEWLQNDEDVTQPDVTLEEPGKCYILCDSNNTLV